VVVASATLALLALAACAQKPATHVLLIGNSYTSYNGGLDAQLERLAPSVDAVSVTNGGFTLKDHWADGRALSAIRQGGWAYVVLQDQSVTPVLATPQFYQYGQSFGDENRRSGAQAVLLMTWQRPDAVGIGVTSESLAAAYNGLGEAMGAKVAPAGTAFAASLKERPDLALTGQDGHPTVYGTYLAACVLYGTLFGTTPVGNVADEPLVPSDVQGYFQRIAARSLGL
jgi:hypothetical protein